MSAAGRRDGGLIVQKYGGSSVADAARLFNVARRIVETYDAGHSVCAVVSARGSTTDDLVRQALEVAPQPPRRELDVLLSAGERISCALLAMAVNRLGREAASFTGSQIGIVTDDSHGRARIVKIRTERLRAALDAGKIALVAGFQGVTEDADVTTLGRGGSDTTAVALAGALRARLCEIYTDVDGVYTANPSVVVGARRLPEMTYEEMMELSDAGAKVLAPGCVGLAAQQDIPLHVLSSFSPGAGTRVSRTVAGRSLPALSGITYTLDEVAFEVHDLTDVQSAFSFLRVLREAGVMCDSTLRGDRGPMPPRLVFMAHEQDALYVDEILTGESARLGVGRLSSSLSMARVSVVGRGLAEDEELARRVSTELQRLRVAPLWTAASGMRLSGLLPRLRVERVVEELHRSLRLDRT